MGENLGTEPREYTSGDRQSQLADLIGLSARMADIARLHDPYLAELLGSRADAAMKLMREGFSQSELNELGYMYPEPLWLDPRQIDYNAPREPWQEQIAEIHPAARRIALELRAVARFS